MTWTRLAAASGMEFWADLEYGTPVADPDPSEDGEPNPMWAPLDRVLAIRVTGAGTKQFRARVTLDSGAVLERDVKDVELAIPRGQQTRFASFSISVIS